MYWGFGERRVFLKKEDMADSSCVLIVSSCEGSLIVLRSITYMFNDRLAADTGIVFNHMRP
jgi:hypothetical protein